MRKVLLATAFLPPRRTQTWNPPAGTAQSPTADAFMAVAPVGPYVNMDHDTARLKPMPYYETLALALTIEFT